MPWPKGKTGRRAKTFDRDFVALFEEIGPTKLAHRLGISDTAVRLRRNNIERKIGRALVTPGPRAQPRSEFGAAIAPGRVDFQIDDGFVIIGSDPHYWPDIVSTAHKGLVAFCKKLTPKAVIMNGDIMDGASISRHPPIGWEKRPTVVEEIEVCKDRLGEITIAAGRARRFWPLGNHDGRFETRLASVAPEYAHVHGVHLKDHFPDWEPCWSVDVNGTLWVSHRYKGGVYAGRNNALNAGRSTATGHLHHGTVIPVTDMNGTRYGLDLPTMADPYGPQFEYQEDNPRDQRSGFAVVRFVEGRMLAPQLAIVVDEGVIDFCNELHRV